MSRILIEGLLVIGESASASTATLSSHGDIISKRLLLFSFADVFSQDWKYRAMVFETPPFLDLSGRIRFGWVRTVCLRWSSLDRDDFIPWPKHLPSESLDVSKGVPFPGFSKPITSAGFFGGQ